MSEIEPLRSVIARYGLSASNWRSRMKFWPSALLARIAAIPGDLDGQSVYEVGPGPGGLTRALLETGARVVAVERDRRCLAPLSELAAESSGRLSVVEADALEIDEQRLAGPGAHVVANLPYNVGTALLLRWLGGEQWPPWWASLTLMFQREVAERIVAKPDTEHFGRLSIAAQWRSQARIAQLVHRSAFVPPPKVMSAVVHIVPEDAPAGVRAATIERLTAAAFGQRRKMLRQSLKGVPGALEALQAEGIDPQRRAETLSVTQFIAVARRLDAID